VTDVAPAAPAAASSAGPVTPGAACATSCATPAPCGSRALTRAVSWTRDVSGALITMALLAGMPRERATPSETTASAPAMPTVPNAPTRSFSARWPATVTRPPSAILSSWPMVYESAMLPLATLCHRAVDRAVGPAANARKVLGSTPSIWMKRPFTLIVAASSAWAATTPGRRAIAAVTAGFSAVGATTSTSASRSWPSGFI